MYGHSNPNGERTGPTVEAICPFLAKEHPQLGLCSAPILNKHQITSI